MALLKANTGIGITNPSEALHVIGNGLFVGIVSATSFIGNLSGTATSAINLVGGEQGSVPYQSSTNSTTFLSPGTPGRVLITAGGGQNPYWGLVSSAEGSFSGITIRDEGDVVGSALSISSLNFVGANITATGSGIAATITIANNLVGTALSISGISTFTNGPVLIGSGTSTGTASQPLQVTGGTYVSGNVGIGTTTPTSKLQVVGNVLVSGIVTATEFNGALTGNVTSADKLFTPRTISLTGDIEGSVSFDGSTNVSIASTIQPNSVGLGTDTFGDYVKNITGTSNQITVTSGTGEGSTPTLSIPDQFTVPQDLTVLRDVQINRNLNVNGNITIGGTSATIFSQSLTVFDPDIVLGYRTDANGNDISTDNTANHGGVAIASTEGSPLVQLFIAGIEINPATYKKIMWFKEGTFSGLGTDAWLSNYAIGIGSTQFPTGTRLAAGSVQFTENDLAVVRNINSSGIISATSFVGSFEGNVTTATYATSAGIATYATNAGVSTNVIGGIGSITRLQVTGISTFTNGPVFIGAATSTGTSSQPLQVTGGAYVSGNLGIGTTNPIQPFQVGFGTNVVVIDSIGEIGIGTTNPTSKLHVVGDINLDDGGTFNTTLQTITATANRVISLPDATGTVALVAGSSGQVIFNSAGIQSGSTAFTFDGTNVTLTGRLSATNLTAQQLNVSGISTLGITSATNLTAQQLNVSGISTLGITSATNLTAQQLNVSGISTLGITSATNLTAQQLNVSGISTFTNGPVLVGAATSTGTAAQRLQVTGGAYVSGNIGIGTTNPTSKLQVQGDVSIASTVGIGTVIDIVPYDTLNSGTLSFEGSAGQLFSITNNLTSGSIFSVNDVSGIPSIDVDANGTVSLVAYSGNVAIGSTGITGTSNQKLQVTGGAYVSGSLGIGTTNPSQSLHVQGNARVTGALYDGTNVAGSSGQILQTTGSAVQWINASTTNVGSANSIGINLDSTDANRYLTFVSTTSGNNVVYVDSDLLYNPSTNSLGINTTSFTGTASQPLQVTGGAYVSGAVGIGTTNPGAKLQVGSATTQSTFITSNGDILVGTNTLYGTGARRLHISGTNSSAVNSYGSLTLANLSDSSNQLLGAIDFYGSSTLAAQIMGSKVIGGAAGGGALSFRVQSGSSLVSVMVIGANSVDIGTNNGVVSASLNIYNSTYGSSTTGITLGNMQTGTGSNIDINFVDYVSNVYGKIRGVYSGTPQKGDIAFFTADAGTVTERVRLNSGGAFLVGTATSTGTASQTLQVTGGAYVSGNLGIGTTTAGAKLQVTPTSTSIAGLFSGTTSSDMVRITQLGTGNAIVVEDETNPDSSPFVVTGIGSVGIGTTLPQYKLHVVGDFGATTKSFSIPHPTKPGLTLRHGSLEGPENGVYVRGKTTESSIPLPDYWTGLVDEESISVNLTPKNGKLHSVVGISSNAVEIECIGGEIDCYFMILGERKDVAKLDVEY